ncbi:MAG: glucose-6-phosphate dehydrogenase [Candidatus Saccharibacteria bacterium]
MTPTILVIIGISGDLAHRRLLPAIQEIAKLGGLPEAFRIVGISRRDLKLSDVAPNDEFWEQHLELHQMDLEDKQAYHKLATQLEGINRSLGGSAQRLFYLSLPPDAVQTVVEMLGETDLSKVPSTKLLLEKPFGTDLASAEGLVADLDKHFKEDQIYRIDHYLAKEMAQNLVVFRAANPVFSQTWNHKFIASIEVIASETIGIEGRGTFYEQTGALRDVVQSHLLQLLALVLMELPKLDELNSIPDLRHQALQQILPAKIAVRGQYMGYRKEVSNPNSNVETFVSVNLESNDPNWKGVPIKLTTGKALDIHTTEIRITYRGEGNSEANVLTLHIQPNEGADVSLWFKKPGFDRQLQQIPLSFEYKQSPKNKLPDAYERVFVDAMRSDHTLFSTSKEVLASWEILGGIQAIWGESADDLRFYEKGSTPDAISAG